MESLAALRRRRFLTQTELANQVGVSMKTVQAWEGGRAQPRLRHIPPLAEALGIPPAELLTLVEQGKAAA
jgi:transcriptional regulator with XRE-family HTH domain